MNSESQAKPEIYAFINARMKGDIQDVVSIALAEDGELLAQHMSSNETWAQYDMGINSGRKHDKYQEHYPCGYNLLWCDAMDPRVEAAYQKHMAKYASSQNGAVQ